MTNWFFPNPPHSRSLPPSLSSVPYPNAACRPVYGDCNQKYRQYRFGHIFVTIYVWSYRCPIIQGQILQMHGRVQTYGSRMQVSQPGTVIS